TLTGEGDFNGKLKIYDKWIDYNEKINLRKKYSRTNYGSCNVKLGYALGEKVDSKLNDTQFDILKKKVTNYGGIYIFRDGFRVLPYGRAREDFLGLEERRSKSIGQYFFSYRRLFGYISITRKGNENLIDKAGREGLINNSWYRAFADDLEGLFISLAKDFFGNKAKKSIFLDQKEQLNQQAKALDEDKRRVTEEKKQFTRSLKLYPERLQEYKKEYQNLVDLLTIKLSKSNVIYNEIESIINDIKEMDLAYKELLPQMPKHYKPTERQLERLNEYEKEVVLFTKTTKKESSNLFKRVNSLLEIHELQKEFENNYSIYKNRLEEEGFKYGEILEQKLSEISSEFKKRNNYLIDELFKEKEKLKLNIQSKDSVLESIKLLNNKYNSLLKYQEEKIFPAVNHINRINFDVDEEILKGAYRTAYEEMKEQWELTNDMAQLGIAVEIIDHEFNVLYSVINNSVKELEPKIIDIPNVSKKFTYLKNAFQQLEDKYELLSPLYHASGILEKNITGASVFKYLKSFFQNSFEKEGIDPLASDKFLNCNFICKEPIVYAVFINLINNAIYWLRSKEDKKIVFDYFEETNEILVMNSGEKIKDFQLTKIFEIFYSKRGGRGLGLYLAKQSLQKTSMDIYASNDENYNKLDGACFVIRINNIVK
ncbi:MAG: ATP-binding protein, partial [Candidatus Nanoarchaeia archaeon]|nr:ATP-binding protein [Candidatus Nanoarchaeia archaeon]